MNICKKSYDKLAQLCKLEESWDECVRFAPLQPVKMFKILNGNQPIPAEAIMNGYVDEEEDDSFVSSYSEFESDALCDDDVGMIMNNVSSGKEFVKNTFFFDQNNPNGGVSAANRIDLNWNDGYLQYDIIAGKTVSRDRLGNSWFDEDLKSQNCPYNEKAQYMVPKTYASLTSDVVFGSNKIGCSDFFFSDRSPFEQAFQDDPVTSAAAMVLDNAINPEYIGFRNNMNGLYAFNDIMSFCNATGAMWMDIAPIAQMLNYFAHNVLTILIPKQIVLLIDSVRGIDIPRKDYIPNILDPVKNIPDYNNKMKHVIELMKEIQSGRLFCARIGGFYLKMTITPAMTIVNLILHNAPDYRLVLNLQTVENQILQDSEEMHGVYPSKYTYEHNPYWHVSRNHNNVIDVLQSMENNYQSKLMGMEGGELQEFMAVHNIHTTDMEFSPDVQDELNVSNPNELRNFLD